MLRFAVLAIFFAVVCTVPINDETDSAELDVFVEDNIDEYLKQNPEVELFEPFEIEDVENRRQIRYTLGRRVNGERNVANVNYASKWPGAQNRSVTFKYPERGAQGALVTFVEFLVEQSTKDGRLRIASGGINQRKISVVIEARRTTHIRYSARVYATN